MGTDAQRLVGLADAEIMARHVAGDPTAFAELVRRYTPPLRGFLARRLYDDVTERVDDLLQELFWRVLRHAVRFDGSRKFSSWLYTIAQNLVYNELRDRHRTGRRLQRWPRHPDGTDVDFPDRADARPDVQYERREQLAIGERLMAALPAPQREVFRLREVDGLRYDVIARRIGVPVGTVKSRLCRARRALRAAARAGEDA